MWVRAGNNHGSEPCLVSVDDVLQVKGVANAADSNYRVQILTDWSQNLFAITAYASLADAQQAADELAQFIAGPQIVET